MKKCTGKYIYCIIKSPKSFKCELNGVGGEKVGLIVSKNLAAVVSDSPITDYPLTRENTTTHLKVIEEVRWSRSEAAKRLGIHRSTLYHKLRHLRIDAS